MSLRGIYVLNFGKFSVNISVLGVLYRYCCTDGCEISHGEVDLGAICHMVGAQNLKIGV